MDEQQFEEFLNEFRELKDDISLDIGRAGLLGVRERVNREGRDFALRDKQMDEEPLFMDRNFPNENEPETDEDSGTIVGVLNSFKTTIFNAKVRNLFEDSTLPLMDKMDILYEAGQFLEENRTSETQDILVTILREIRHWKEDQPTSLLRTVRSHVDLFFRNPVWNSFVGAMKLLNFTLTPIFRGIRFLLFGGQKKPVDVRILEAIKDQTQFMMTGRIFERGFFERFSAMGALGLAGRGALSAIAGDISRGIGARQVGGIEAARERQRLREEGRGEEVGRNFITDFFDDLYRQDITRAAFGSRAEDTGRSQVLEEILETNDILGAIQELTGQNVMSLTSIDENIRSLTFMNAAVMANVRLGDLSPETEAIRMMSEEMQHGFFDLNRIQEKVTSRVIESNVGIAAAQAEQFRNDSLKEEIREQVRSETYQRLADGIESIEDSNSDIRRFSRGELIETRRLRRQSFITAILGTVGSLAGSIVGALGSLGGSLIGAIGSAAVGLGSTILGGLSTLAAAIGVKSLAGRAGGMIGGVGKGRKPGKAGRVGKILSGAKDIGGKAIRGVRGAGLFGVLTAAGLSLSDYFSSDEENRPQLGGVLSGIAGGAAGVGAGGAAGAALGALGGPAAPITVPVGWLVGSLIGGEGGRQLGEGIFNRFFAKEEEQKPEEQPATNENVQDMLSDHLKRSKEFLSDYSQAAREAAAKAKSFTGRLLGSEPMTPRQMTDDFLSSLPSAQPQISASPSVPLRPQEPSIIPAEAGSVVEDIRNTVSNTVNSVIEQSSSVFSGFDFTGGVDSILGGIKAIERVLMDIKKNGENPKEIPIDNSGLSDAFKNQFQNPAPKGIMNDY